MWDGKGLGMPAAGERGLGWILEEEGFGGKMVLCEIAGEQ